MQNLSIIANISQNYGLGHGGELLWHIPEDMKFFRITTTDKCVIMGRKTYESIGRPLPNRRNIVLTRSTLPGVEICHNIEELDRTLEAIAGEKFIIGGATLYNIYIDRADRLYLTEVDAVKPADTFFPEFDRSKFDRRVLQTGEHEGIKYEIVEYTRKS